MVSNGVLSQSCHASRKKLGLQGFRIRHAYQGTIGSTFGVKELHGMRKNTAVLVDPGLDAKVLGVIRYWANLELRLGYWLNTSIKSIFEVGVFRPSFRGCVPISFHTLPLKRFSDSGRYVGKGHEVRPLMLRLASCKMEGGDHTRQL